jgi:hypothetical protein
LSDRQTGGRAARALVLKMRGIDGWYADDASFTQVLLPDYMRNSRLEDVWKVAFDDRGHFTEPHTNHSVGLGTLAVRGYLQSWQAPTTKAIDIDAALESLWPIPTAGPHGRYGAALFIEKEGFLPLFDSINLAERFDLAILSTKGMSVTACRRLVEKLSAEKITTYVLHHFDQSGLTILNTQRHAAVPVPLAALGGGPRVAADRHRRPAPPASAPGARRLARRRSGQQQQQRASGAQPARLGGH